jgi:ferrochelatase
MARRALLVVGHGTITASADVPEFLRRIRRGRPPSAELVEEIKRRYRAIGRSPLLDTTEALGRALEARLGITTRVAMRFWDQLVEKVVAELVASGVEQLCVLPVAPFSVHVYVDVVKRALLGLVPSGGSDVKVIGVRPYGSDEAFVLAQAAKIYPLVAGRSQGDTLLILSAHSLPTAVIASGDPYKTLFEDSARAIAAKLGWEAQVVLFQPTRR